MYSRIPKPFQKSSSEEPSTKSRFTPRGFVIQPKVEEVKPQQEQTPDLQNKPTKEDQYSNGFPNASVFRYVPPPRTPRVQMKLTLGQSGDKYEQEADKVAADVVQQINVQGVSEVQDESVGVAGTGSRTQRQEAQSNAGVVQRAGVKELTTAAEEERRKQQAQKFKNPTKKTLEKFFTNQETDRKTEPKKLEQNQDEKEMLEEHLKKKFQSGNTEPQSQQESSQDVLTELPEITAKLNEIKQEYESCNDNETEKLSSIKESLKILLMDERRIRKVIQKTLGNLHLRFKQLGGMEALENVDEQAEVAILGGKIEELHTQYKELCQSRIKTKVLVLGDNRNIASKKENAKYKKLLKMETEYRHDESKQLRVEGHDLSEENKNVQYLTPEQRESYKIKPVKRGEETIYVGEDDQAVDSEKATQTQSAVGGTDGIFIYVMSEDGDLYVADEGKESKDNEKFHHSSFLGGKPVAAAGEIAFSSGKVTEISNISGHYQPDLSYIYQALLELRSQGMNISEVTVKLAFKPIDFTLKKASGEPWNIS